MPTGPRWFKVFVHDKSTLSLLPPDAVGRGLLSAMEYAVNRSPPTELDQPSTVAFNVFRAAVDNSFNKCNNAVDKPENDETNCVRQDKPARPPTPDKLIQIFSDEIRRTGKDYLYPQDEMYKFFRYYAKNGLNVGDKPIQDWEGLARAWVQRALPPKAKN